MVGDTEWGFYGVSNRVDSPGKRVKLLFLGVSCA